MIHDCWAQVADFYKSFSGYEDELLWAAGWLYRASGDAAFLDYIVTNQQTLNAAGSASEFSWDGKAAGADVLLAREFLSCGVSSDPVFGAMKNAADQVRKEGKEYKCRRDLL